MDRRTDGAGNAGLPIDPAEFSAAMGQAHPSPDMARLRAYRLERVRDQLRRRDLAGCLLFDPVNIRYANVWRYERRASHS